MLGLHWFRFSDRHVADGTVALFATQTDIEGGLHGRLVEARERVSGAYRLELRDAQPFFAAFAVVAAAIEA